MTRSNMGCARTCYRTRKLIPFFTKCLIQLGILLVASCAIANAQYFRRPAPTSSSLSPSMEAYRQKWMDFLKQRTTVAPPLYRHPVRGSNSNSNGSGGGKNGLVVNGFLCERTYDLFPNKNNPRMYHLCARSRDNWYVYHYFCPHGSFFSDGQKRCMQERNVNVTNPSIRTTTVRNRRPFHTTTTRPPISSTRRPSTTTTTTTTTTSTEAPIPETGMTENYPSQSSSSEEFSPEEEMNMRDVVVHDYTMAASSSSDEIEEVTKENDESSDESNMIPESVNEPSRLPSSSTSTPSPLPPKEMKRKKITSPPTKPKKNAVDSNSDASGGRRPRILKKWRDFISKY